MTLLCHDKSRDLNFKSILDMSRVVGTQDIEDIAASTVFSDTADPDGARVQPPAPSGSFARLLLYSFDLPAPVIAASFMINILGLALPLAVLQVFDRVLQNQSYNTMIVLLTGLICAIVVETILRIARNKLISQIALHESFHLQMRAAASLLSTPRIVAAKLPPKTAADALTGVDEMSQFLAGNGRLALLDFPFVLLFLGIIAAIGGYIVVTPIILIIVFTVWTIYSSAAMKAILRSQMQLENERFAYYTECLKGIATVKSLAVEPQMLRRFETILQSGLPLGLDQVLSANRMAASGQLFASLTMISVVSIGGAMVIQGMMSIGALAACTLITNRVVQPVMRIIAVWGQLETARLAQERFMPVINLPQQAASAIEEAGPASVELASLAMGDRETPGSSSSAAINLKIKPGEIIGIISRNFTQRKELFGLLRGTLKPTQGAVLIDGADPSSLDGDAIQQGIYFLSSSPAIFRGSILDNISMFRSISYGTAISTARALGLEPIIQTLPDGFETQLNDIGASALPTDILQAICVVRAVAMKPRMVVFDVRRIPPDDVSTRACTQAINELRGNTTIIILGKNISEMKEADRIFALQGWTLEKIVQRTKKSVSEQSRKLIAERFDLDKDD